MKTKIKRISAAGVLAAVAVLSLAGSAAAHVTASPEEAEAGGYARLEFGVPHGCEGSPTTRVRVQIPDTVPSVTPQRNPLWSLSTKEGSKQPTEAHGETITEGISEVIWTARQPLPDHELDVLGMSVLLPDAAGETVYFPTIQECERGEERWIQIPTEGESAEELESPAPQVLLAAATDGHGSEAAAEAEEDNGDGAPTWLAVAALVVGAIGLLAGGAALARSRRSA